jgi:hypothetical protein
MIALDEAIASVRMSRRRCGDLDGRNRPKRLASAAPPFGEHDPYLGAVILAGPLTATHAPNGVATLGCERARFLLRHVAGPWGRDGARNVSHDLDRLVLAESAFRIHSRLGT